MFTKMFTASPERGIMENGRLAELGCILDALTAQLNALTPMRDETLLVRLAWNDLNSAVHALSMVTDRTPPPTELEQTW
jgi:hypothetical protein